MRRKNLQNVEQLHDEGCLSDEVLYKTVKWVPAEWGYDDSDLDQSELVLVSDYLAEKRESIEDSRFQEFLL